MISGEADDEEIDIVVVIVDRVCIRCRLIYGRVAELSKVGSDVWTDLDDEGMGEVVKQLDKLL